MTESHDREIGASEAPPREAAAHVAPRSPLRALAGLGVGLAEDATQAHTGRDGAEDALTAAQGRVEDPEEAALREVAWGLHTAANGIEKLLRARQIRLAASRASSLMDPVNARTETPWEPTPPEPRSSESEPEQLLTRADLAELLQVSDRTVKRWLDDGELPPGLEIGGVVRWERRAVLDWIRERGGGGNG